jgi:ABC-2 type transport system ATP-binding protein
MLVIDSVSKKLGPRQVLRQASLRYPGPGTLWLRGPNGAGKSTLLRCVAGVWRPDAGDVLVCGRSTVREGRARAQVGYVPDTLDPFPDLTVMEMFALVSALKRSALPDRSTIDRFGVSGFLHQGVARLSAGQTRRAALVAGLIGNPWLLALDEPTIGLDVEGVALLRQILLERRQAGQATLLVAHEPSLAGEVGADVCDVRDGALMAMPPAGNGPEPSLVFRA